MINLHESKALEEFDKLLIDFETALYMAQEVDDAKAFLIKKNLITRRMLFFEALKEDMRPSWINVPVFLGTLLGSLIAYGLVLFLEWVF